MNGTTMACVAAAAAAAATAAGCIHVTTESEIKPIHITMDVNVKVDRELDKAFADENRPKPQGPFKEVKALLDRGAAGVTNRALLEAREGATDDDKMLVAEENMRRTKRFEEIAKASDVPVEAVQKRRAAQMREKAPAGCGIWMQDDSGAWARR